MIKVMTIFGTRPEAIKMAPLVKELESRNEIESIVCVTAQHREMLDQVLVTFKIKPDYDLNIMKQGQTLGEVTTRALNGLESVIKECKPDIVLVHGDTTTTFAGALASFYNQVAIGHVEAGLRTYDKYSPFPEEMNRKMISQIAELYFAPTENNKKNLKKENIQEGIYVTGNTVIDAFPYTVKKDYIFKEERIKKIDFYKKRLILMTAHRRENLGKPLENICYAIKHLAEENRDIQVVYPVHLNPVVRSTVYEILGNVERVYLTEPMDVEDMHNLMSQSFLIMTDSGGLQEEGPHFGIPVVVLRTETERPEAVEAGTVVVAGTKEEEIFEIANTLLNNTQVYEKMAHAINPYGDGHASERIVEALIEWKKNKKNELEMRK